MKTMDKDELNLMTMAIKYADEDKARELLESLRWPKGPVCIHCGHDRVYRLTPRPTSKSPGRNGLLKCAKCRRQFTVLKGTIFESSHITCAQWVMAIYLMCASKKGISACQLERMLNLSYKSAWFLAHRVRHMMTEGPFAKVLSGDIEVDETYVGGKPRYGTGKHKTGRGTKKTPVVALVQRDGGVKTRVVDRVNAKTLHAAILENVDKDSRIVTDEWPGYRGIGKHYGGRHFFVNHSAKQYVNGPIHTNTVESFFALLKRGVVGSFHHVSRKHLHRYANEFAFRWTNRKVDDSQRTKIAIGMAEGKRLMYRDSSIGEN